MNFSDENVPLGKKPKTTKVRNKTPAPIQITAEQLLREAKERELEATPKPPQQKITTEAEKKEYQLQKRQDYENNIRKDRLKIMNWMKYAGFEKSQGEINRARNVFERALNVHYREVSIWLKYIEMEVEFKQINHARTLLDRAIAMLPRANQLWYKYVYIEQKLNNIEVARRIFKKWMRWEPEESAWHAFINMEVKYGEISNAHEIYKKFVQVHQDEKNWIKWAKFEERNRRIDIARNVFESAVNYFGKENPPSKILIEFARFEERQREHERVKAIFSYALDNLPKSMSEEIYKAYHDYEKKYGDKMTIQDSIVIKRKYHYEKLITDDKYNYDEWFGYIKMMEDENQDPDEIRALYERAIANKPLIEKKYYWRRYIYLWIKYAIFEELRCDNSKRAREIYNVCLTHIPHKKFTFAKIWIFLAELEIRQDDLGAARKVLGNALGRCPKNKLFRYYIEIETTLLEFDRVRKLYEKFIIFCPSYHLSWMEYAKFEQRVKEFDRVREIYEKALETDLEKPSFVWKSYIDFEASIEEFEKCWQLHERLLEIEEHALVWISYAKMQLSNFDADVDNPDDVVKNAREIFKRANSSLRSMDNAQRELLLIQWKEFEQEFGSEDTLEEVVRKCPRKVTKPKRIDNDDGTSTWVDELSLEFPDDVEESQMQRTGVDDLETLANEWFSL